MCATSRRLKDVLPKEDLREVGSHAVWSLSSCKPGNGVQQLRDDSTDSYWQSDGSQPHLVNVNFRRKTAVAGVALFTDFKADESYTPSRVSVRVGTHLNDLRELVCLELFEPSGWAWIDLTQQLPPPLQDGQDVPLEEELDAHLGYHQGVLPRVGGVPGKRPIRTWMVQLGILGNHQNGRDTHVRQVKVFAPATNHSTMDSSHPALAEGAMQAALVADSITNDDDLANAPMVRTLSEESLHAPIECFSTIQMRQHACFR